MFLSIADISIQLPTLFFADNSMVPILLFQYQLKALSTQDRAWNTAGLDISAMHQALRVDHRIVTDYEC